MDFLQSISEQTPKCRKFCESQNTSHSNSQNFCESRTFSHLNNLETFEECTCHNVRSGPFGVSFDWSEPRGVVRAKSSGAMSVALDLTNPQRIISFQGLSRAFDIFLLWKLSRSSELPQPNLESFASGVDF